MTAPLRADGQPLTVSASSISRYRECPRAWWYEAVLGLRRPPSEAAQLGTDVHTAIEGYLLTGAWPAHVKGRGRPVEIARAGGAGELALAPLRQLVEAGRAHLEVRTPDGLTLGGLPLRGRIDVVWSGDHGLVGITDHKTTSRPENRLTEPELRKDTQLSIYAWAAWRDLRPPRVALEHVVFATRGAPSAVRTRAVVPWEDVLWTHSRAADDARAMAPLASVREAADVPENRGSCSAWGGCPHLARCPAHRTVPTTPNNTGEPLYDLDALWSKPTTAPAAPPPAPAPAAPPPAPAAPVFVELTDAQHADLVAYATSLAVQHEGTNDPGALAIVLHQWASDRGLAPLRPTAVEGIAEYSIRRAPQELAARRAAAAPVEVAPGAVAPPDEPVGDQLAALVATLGRWGRWPGDEVAGQLAREVGVDLERARAAAYEAHGWTAPEPTPTPAPAARPLGKVDPDDLAAAVALPLSAGPLGSDTWWAAFRSARGVARLGEVRKAGILAALASHRETGPAPTLTIRPADEPDPAQALDVAGVPPVPFDPEPAPPVATAPAPTPPAPVASVPAPPAPTPTPAPPPAQVWSLPILLVDALPMGLPSVPLRVFFAAAIQAVEAAEGRPVDLVDYGKGPALVASRVATSPPPPPPHGGVLAVAAESHDPLTRALLPLLAGRGWLVIRGVR